MGIKDDHGRPDPGAGMSRRAVVGGLAASLALPAGPAAAQAVSLGAIAAQKGILFGSALDYPDHRIFNDRRVASLYAQQCTQFVMGHQMLWGPNQGSAGGRFNFSKADAAVNFAARHGKIMSGHCLIWHSFVPRWLAGEAARGRMPEVITRHVSTAVDRYRGRLNYWVVVNEPFDWLKRRPDGLIPTPFAEGLGETYIDLAFQAAAEADPSARLVLNEVGMEHDYPDAQRKRDLVIRTVKRLKSKGIPTHAVGLQAHLRPQYPFSKAKLRGFLNQVQRLGLKIYITEMDVDDNSLPSDISRRDAGVAAKMGEFLDVCLANSACDTVMMWGLLNRYNWLNLPEQPVPAGLDQHSLQLPRKDGLPHRPTLYDDDLQPTAAWHAVARALEKARRR